LHLASLQVKYWHLKAAAEKNRYDATLTLQDVNTLQLRIAFLHELRERIATRKTSSKLSPEESLKCIDCQVKQTTSFANVQYPIKPTTFKPLSNVHVTTKTMTTGVPVEASHVEVVDTRIELEQQILARNKKHFAQAEGTPFTQAPLNLMTATNALNYFDENGEPIGLPGGTFAETKMVLQLLKEALNDPPPNIDATLSFDDFVTSFLKWNENTLTSPSGQHLGLYIKLVTAHCDSGSEFDDAEDKHSMSTKTKSFRHPSSHTYSSSYSR
jgi:hypothetical protein